MFKYVDVNRTLLFAIESLKRLHQEILTSILAKTSHPSAQPLEQSFDAVCVSQGAAGYYQ